MSLQAPWRLSYIRSLDSAGAGDGCFLCDAAGAAEADFPRLLVLWRTPLTVVLLNKYPYSNGHVLLAPLAHKAEWEDLGPEEVADIGLQTQQVLRLLRRCVSAQGFNIGINLGRCAGAGVPGHLHQHIVPRWMGDTNYMAVIGEVRVVPQAPSQLWAELIRCRAELSQDATGR